MFVILVTNILPGFINKDQPDFSMWDTTRIITVNYIICTFQMKDMGRTNSKYCIHNIIESAHALTRGCGNHSPGKQTSLSMIVWLH